MLRKKVLQAMRIIVTGNSSDMWHVLLKDFSRWCMCSRFGSHSKPIEPKAVEYIMRFLNTAWICANSKSVREAAANMGVSVERVRTDLTRCGRPQVSLLFGSFLGKEYPELMTEIIEHFGVRAWPLFSDFLQTVFDRAEEVDAQKRINFLVAHPGITVFIVKKGAKTREIDEDLGAENATKFDNELLKLELMPFDDETFEGNDN